MPKIEIDYSGWCKVDAGDTQFYNFDTKEIIPFVEWQALSDEDKQNCVINNLIQIIQNAENSSWGVIDLTISED